MNDYTATYSPEDNKLRIYGPRFDAETYERVKAAGYRWAPKQELWVAPAWTPEREDLALELAGEVGDEDTSLVDRAEERADRFEDYRDKRAQDAEAARQGVARIADNIPFGQPILVGHHSEKHARKDAERIENGMRRAVKMWKTSEYWTRRAAGALAHAKYKERPEVRARRIKGLEADERRCLRTIEGAEKERRGWSNLQGAKKKDGTPADPRAFALYLANYGQHIGHGLWSALKDEKITLDDARAQALASIARTIEINSRWLEHTRNRLAYERAMLGEAGGLITDRTKPEKGGAVRSLWAPRGGWAYIHKVNRLSVTVKHQWNDGGRVFSTTVPFDKLRGIMSAADVQAKRDAGELVEVHPEIGFILAPAQEPKTTDTKAPAPKPEPKPDAGAFEAMQATLRAGVQVVSAPQLFPTPPDLAARMVGLADVQPGQRILEPSAGTGRLVEALPAEVIELHTVEINNALCRRLNTMPGVNSVTEADFLACNGDLGLYDRIVMNPPFKDAEDVKHILHARNFLQPGGRLVALCANGPRQQAALRPLADFWEELPAGTFDGTGVRAVLLRITAPEAPTMTTRPVQAALFA